MKNGIANPMRRSKRGTTLVELIVALSLTAIFAVVCVALINPIERTYKQMERISRAELLADTIVDSIRKECDEAKNDDINSVWIADGNINDDSSLFDEDCALKKTEGHILVFKKNNSYCEAIFSELKITEQNKTDANNNTLEGTLSGHAVDELFEGSKENTEKGIVHFGYYQAGDKGNGIYPLKSYDYTNPVLASTYGDFYVKIYFKNLVTRDVMIDSVKHTIPSFVECEVRVYEGDYISSDTEAAKNIIYTRTAALSFSANGSAPGSSYHKPDPAAEKKNIKVQVVWDDENITTKRQDVTVSLLMDGSAVASKLVEKMDSRPFVFANVTINGEVSLGLTEVEKYTCTYTGNVDDGYVVTYKYNKQKTVKLIRGEEFIKKLGQDVNYVVFGKKSDYPEITAGSGTKVAIPYTANWDNMSDLKDDYMLYKVTTDGVKTAYILSDDGEFVFNENCKKMFINCHSLTAITGITAPATNGVVFDTSITKNMMSMFEGCDKITSFYLPDFVTGACETIDAMFKNCTGITEFDFGNWDTSGIQTMKNMFNGCTALETVDGMYNKDFGLLASWESAFSGCSQFHELDISGIKIPSITSQDAFRKIFNNVTIKTLNMSGARLGLTTFDNLFNNNNCRSLESVDFSNVISGKVSAEQMFYGCSNLESVKIEATNPNSFKLTNGHRMFRGCKKLTDIKFKGLIGKECTDISEMFYDCAAVPELDFQGSDFSGLTTMKDLCRGCEELTSVDLATNCTISNNLINCQSVVRRCHKLESFKAKDLCVSNFQQAFDECYNLTDLNLSNIDASRCTLLVSMFRQCYKLEEFDFNSFKRRSDGVLDLSKVIAIKTMFIECTSLSSIKNMTNIDFSSMENTFVDDQGNTTYSLLETFKSDTNLKELDISGIQLPKIDNKTDFFRLFNNSSITILNMSGAKLTGLTSFEDFFNGRTTFTEIDFSNVQAGSTNVSTKGMFQKCTNLETVKFYSTDSGCIESTNANLMFSGCTHIARVEGFKAPADCTEMFKGCNITTGIVLADWNTEAVVDMSNMFNGCSKMETIDLSSFDTSSVTNMAYMFIGCNNLEFNSSSWTNWDTSNVTNMTQMFYNCGYSPNANVTSGSLTINISNFSFASVESFYEMFNCDAGDKDMIKEIILPSGDNAKDKANTENGVTTYRMFRNRKHLKSIVNLGDFSIENKIASIVSMFAASGVTEIDISSLDIGKVPKDFAKWMFNDCKSLEKIYVNPDVNYEDFSNVHKDEEMFKNDSDKLRGQNGTVWNSSNIKGGRAQIDEGPTSTKPGYFSVK